MTQILGDEYPPSDPRVLAHFEAAKYTVLRDLEKLFMTEQRDLPVTAGKPHFSWFLATIFE